MKEAMKEDVKDFSKVYVQICLSSLERLQWAARQTGPLRAQALQRFSPQCMPPLLSCRQ